MMRKGFILGMVLVLLLPTLVGCGTTEKKVNLKLVDGTKDVHSIQEKGTLVVGVTDFLPLDYKEKNTWTGFDSELAKQFAASLGVNVKFQEIPWDKKIDLLEQGKIDCIWNGMTLTDTLKQSISCSDAYLTNSQVVVMPKENVGRYKKIEDAQHLLFAVESGSAGEDIINGKKYRYSACENQKAALEQVLSSNADAAVVDLIMAGYCIEKEDKYKDLAFQILLNQEQMSVGFRKNSDLTVKVNAFIQQSYADGTMDTLANKYGLKEGLIQKTEEK